MIENILQFSRVIKLYFSGLRGAVKQDQNQILFKFHQLTDKDPIPTPRFRRTAPTRPASPAPLTTSTPPPRISLLPLVSTKDWEVSEFRSEPR